MKKLVLSYFTLLLFLSTARAQNNAIVFEGLDDYVDCGTNSLLAATNIRTLECWVYFNSLSGAQEILSKSTSGNGIELLLFGGNLAFYCMNNVTGATSYIAYPASNLAVTRWYHLVATWDGTKENMRLYVNGIAVGTRTDVGNINVGGVSDPATSFKLGQWALQDRPFNGVMDEARVWSTVRTQAQIKQTMQYPPATNAAGLIAYYRMNEGIAGTTANATPNAGLNGTLTNGPVWTASPIQYTSNALDIDELNDYVTVPGNTLLDLTSGTVEFMVRINAFTLNENHCILGVRGSGGTRYSFHITASTIGFFNGTYYTVSTTNALNTWYHYAFVGNGTNITVYKNGVSIGTIAATFGTAVSQTLIMGRVRDASDYEELEGAIDEVRIWSTQRTPAQINANRTLALTGTETGLNALYSFNQGISSGSNVGLTTAVDGTANNLHGTLVNFDMGGTQSNYIANTMSLLPVTYSSFTIKKQNGQAQLQWKTEQESNSRSFVVERSTNGTNYEAIGEVKASGNSTIPVNYAFTDENPNSGNNYYRLKQIDLDEKSAYSVVLTAVFESLHRLLWYAPGRNNIEIRLEDGKNERYKLVDLKGSVLQTGVLRNGRVRFEGLKAGSYIVQVQSTALMMKQIVVN